MNAFQTAFFGHVVTQSGTILGEVESSCYSHPMLHTDTPTCSCVKKNVHMII